MKWGFRQREGLLMKGKHILTCFLFVGLAVVTYYIIFSKDDFQKTLLYIRDMDGWYVMLGGAVSLLVVCLEGFMIWYLLHAVHGVSSIPQCISYSFIGFFFSAITPSSTGGQPMQLFYMKRDRNELADSTVVLMSVAVIYKLVLVLIGIALLIGWNGGLHHYLGRYIWLYYLGMLLNASLVVILLAIMAFPAFLTGVLTWGERILVRLRLLKPSEQRLERIAGFVDGYKGTVSFFSTNKKKIGVVVGITFLQRISAFFITYLVYCGFHLSGTGCLTIMILRASIYIAVDMLPLPGAQGITEFMYGSVYRSVFSKAMLPAALGVTRGLDFYFPLLVSALVLMWRMAWHRRSRRVRLAE